MVSSTLQPLAVSAVVIAVGWSSGMTSFSLLNRSQVPGQSVGVTWRSGDQVASVDLGQVASWHPRVREASSARDRGVTPESPSGSRVVKSKAPERVTTAFTVPGGSIWEAVA